LAPILIFIPFWVVEHWKSEPDKHGACLSDSEFTVPGSDWSAQSSRRPIHGAVFLWFCFFCPYKRNELAHEGRNFQLYASTRI